MKRAKDLMPVDAAGVAAILALSAGAYLLGAKPAAAARLANADDRALLARTWEEVAQRDRDLAAARDRLAVARAGAAVAVHFVSPSALNQRLGELSSAAEPSGVRVAEIVPSPAVAAGQFKKIMIRVSGDATYTQAAALLRDLHREFPDTEILSFTLSGQPENPGSVGRVSLDLAWYVKPPPRDRADRAGSAGEKAPPEPR